MPNSLLTLQLALLPTDASEPKAPSWRTTASLLRALLSRPSHRGSRPLDDPDPGAVTGLPGLPARLRLVLLDRLFRAMERRDPPVLERFAEAYLGLGQRGVSRLPGVGGRAVLARLALRTIELAARQLAGYWRDRVAPPPELWTRLLTTFREAAAAGLLTRRSRDLSGAIRTTIGARMARTGLEAVANPYAWEPELYPHLQRFLDLLAEEVLLFPASSPSAFAEARTGRFVMDLNAATGPHLPGPGAGAESNPGQAQWWVLDASRVLDRLRDMNRALQLGVPPDRIHGELPGIPDPARRILMDRLAWHLKRESTRPRSPGSGGSVELIAGLEPAVRFCFAWRWSAQGDPRSLDRRIRLQTEVGTGGRPPPGLSPWEVVERSQSGVRLRGKGPPDSALVGQAVMINTVPDKTDTAEEPPRAGIVRWQRNEASGLGSELGVELLRGSPRDCWCRPSRGAGSPLQEHPGLWLPGEATAWDSLVLPSGLARQGERMTVRADEEQPVVEVQAVEERGVHFDRVTIRTTERT